MTSSSTSNYKWLFWLTLFLFVCGLIYLLRSVLLPFAAGITLGYLFDPWTSYLEKKGLNRTIATLLVILVAILIFIPIVAVLLHIIDEQFSQFLKSLPNYMASLTNKTEPVIIDLQEKFPSLNAEKIKASFNASLADNLKLIGGVIRKLLSKGFAFFNLLSLILITPVVTFYMLRDWDRFVAKVDGLLPRKSKKSIRQQAKEIDRTLAGFIRGQISVCLLLGTYYGLCLYFIGLDLGVVIGFMAGILSFIPYIGSTTGFILSLLMAFAQFDNILPVILVVLVFALGQFIEGNFLTPKLVGKNVGLHPVWIMFALLAGGVLLGFLGLLIAVPTAAVIGVLVRHAIDNYKHSSLYLED